MSQEILDKVCSIVSEQLSVEAGEVKSDSNFQNDLGADSLDTVELVMALEEAFDIEIPEQAAEGIAKAHPLKRLGEGKDSAALAKFLLTEDSSWVTGQIIAVDGGRSKLS